MRKALEETGEEPAALYHLACLETRAGLHDEDRAHLRRAIELYPDIEERARGDEDLAPIVGSL